MFELSFFVYFRQNNEINILQTLSDFKARIPKISVTDLNEKILLLTKIVNIKYLALNRT